MSETQPAQELSTQELMRSAYDSFKDLAQKHGQSLAESMGLDVNGKALGKVEIPPTPGGHKHSDAISGKDFGTGDIDIFYRKGDKAAQISLSENQAGEIVLQRVIPLKVNHAARGFFTMTRDTVSPEPDMHAVIELIDKAGKILRGEEPGIAEKVRPTDIEKVERRERVSNIASGLKSDLARRKADALAEKKKKNGNGRRTGRRKSI